MNANFINFSIGPIITALNANQDEKKIFKPPTNWQKFTKSTIQSHHTNLGVLTGSKSNLTILDFDNISSFKIFIKDYPELKKCHMVKTRNGMHIY